MFREMRRKAQGLPMDECLRILSETTHGVLAVCGDDGYPYAVPLNHVMLDGKIYFHCAVEGHKLDAILNCDKVSFCAIDASDVDGPAYVTQYRSVIAFGRARIVREDESKMRALVALCEKFCPPDSQRHMQEIRLSYDHAAIVEMTIEHLSGKESRALAAQRKQA